MVVRHHQAMSSAESAFAARLEHHRAELQVHCYRMLGSFEDSEDLVQETFLRAWRGRSGFDPGGRSSFRAWLYKITGDVAEFVAGLKQADGPEIQVHGSPGLLQTLLRHDLVDRFRVWTYPLVIGAGKRLFGDGTHPAALKLLDSKVSTTGVTIATYERAGDVDPGSFEFEQPSEAELERRRRLAAS
jgi:sigma-70-like protein/RibD domain-containing protein